MKPISGKRLCRILEKRGWTLIRIKGSHHVYGRPDSPRLLPVPVHGNQDLPTGTQRFLMRQADLTDEDL